jgi:hypothetical protein
VITLSTERCNTYDIHYVIESHAKGGTIGVIKMTENVTYTSDATVEKYATPLELVNLLKRSHKLLSPVNLLSP